jgi:hypothetical protein
VNKPKVIANLRSHFEFCDGIEVGMTRSGVAHATKKKERSGSLWGYVTSDNQTKAKARGGLFSGPAPAKKAKVAGAGGAAPAPPHRKDRPHF